LVKKSATGELPVLGADFPVGHINGTATAWAGRSDGWKEMRSCCNRPREWRSALVKRKSARWGYRCRIKWHQTGVGDEVIGLQVLPVEGEIFSVARMQGQAGGAEGFEAGRYGKA